jgi:hypothetical protein
MIILFFRGVEKRSNGLVIELLIWRVLQLLAGDICPAESLKLLLWGDCFVAAPVPCKDATTIKEGCCVACCSVPCTTCPGSLDPD